ncbi:MAG: hypothetical protein AAFO07_33620 [Bacteroidota bacterium]
MKSSIGLYVVVLIIAMINWSVGYQMASKPPTQEEAIEVIGHIAFDSDRKQMLHNTNQYVLIYVHKLNPKADTVWKMVEPVLWPEINQRTNQ